MKACVRIMQCRESAPGQSLQLKPRIVSFENCLPPPWFGEISCLILNSAMNTEDIHDRPLLSTATS